MMMVGQGERGWRIGEYSREFRKIRGSREQRNVGGEEGE